MHSWWRQLSHVVCLACCDMRRTQYAQLPMVVAAVVVVEVVTLAVKAASQTLAMTRWVLQGKPNQTRTQHHSTSTQVTPISIACSPQRGRCWWWRRWRWW